MISMLVLCCGSRIACIPIIITIGPVLHVCLLLLFARQSFGNRLRNAVISDGLMDDKLSHGFLLSEKNNAHAIAVYPADDINRGSSFYDCSCMAFNRSR